MTDCPHATALVYRVLGLEGADLELPLQVLINLHRARLREPLQRLASTTDKTILAVVVKAGTSPHVEAIKALLHDRWPSLDDGRALRDSPMLFKLSGELHDGIPNLADESLLELAGCPDEATAQLILYSTDAWSAYDPLYLLHRLSWPAADTQRVLAALEIELGLDPAYAALVEEFLP